MLGDNLQDAGTLKGWRIYHRLLLLRTMLVCAMERGDDKRFNGMVGEPKKMSKRTVCLI